MKLIFIFLFLITTTFQTFAINNHSNYRIVHKDYHPLSGIERNALLDSYKEAAKKLVEEGHVQDIIVNSIAEYSVPFSCFVDEESLYHYSYYSLMYEVYSSDIYSLTMEGKIPFQKKELFDKNCRLSEQGSVLLDQFKKSL